MSENDSATNQKLFRKVALARLSSPDRMDALLGIGRPLTVLAWAGAIVVATTFLIWGFHWRIEQKIGGRCILISPSGIAEVTASAGGVVDGLNVKLGDQIAKFLIARQLLHDVAGRSVVAHDLDEPVPEHPQA